MMTKLAASTLLLSAFLSAQAQDQGFSTIQITVDYIEVTPAVASELLHGEKPPTSSAQWHAELKKLLAQENAKLLATLSVTTKSGQRATAESVREKIYATEFAPAAGRKEHSPPVPASLSGVDIPTPTAFEMRPVGARLEVDPILGADGKAIDLNLAPELTYDFGTEAQLTLPTEGAERELITMPRFYTLKTQTATTVTDGGSSLLGVLMPPGEPGNPDGEKRVLCFVTARIIRG